MTQLTRGYVQVYTGNGKGKTTAALGQALRAAGWGLKTFMVRFMKDFPYGELESVRYLGAWIRLEQYGNDAFVLNRRPPQDGDFQAAAKGLKRAREVLRSREYDIVILDEVCVAVYYGLLEMQDVLELVEEKPGCVELILTGRYCPQELIEKADLVTEMQELKHYYKKGGLAREGIDS